MLARHIAPLVKQGLEHFPALLITGARQVGKSTLALNLGIQHAVTFDDMALYQSAKADPKGFITSLPKPVIIDEVQRVPEIFVAIKEHIDTQRVAGTFVLTGSSNFQGFRDISDSLAGRVAIIDLYPFSLGEIRQTRWNIIDGLYEKDLFHQAEACFNLPDQILKGGFPEVQTITQIQIRYLWFSSYIRTYIERDLHDISNLRNLDRFTRLYLSLAYRSANLLNKAELGRESQVDNKTLDHYLSLLQHTYQVHLVKPFYRNPLKRLVKMPKLFMLDSGLLCHLLKINNPRRLHESPARGSIYETFVLSELIKANTWAESPADITFYRTSDGKEIDFILDNGTAVIALEVKASQSVHPDDFRHIRHFIDQNPDRIKKGLVLYSGKTALPFGEYQGTPLQAVPIGALGG
ncbi:ATP-binding protein [Desulfonatronum parangueonense]